MSFFRPISLIIIAKCGTVAEIMPGAMYNLLVRHNRCPTAHSTITPNDGVPCVGAPSSPRANICDSSKHTSSILIAGCRPVVEITLSRNRCLVRERPCNDDA